MTSGALAARDVTAPQQPHLTAQRDDVSLVVVSDWPGANGVFINGFYLPEGSNNGKTTYVKRGAPTTPDSYLYFWSLQDSRDQSTK